MHEIALQRMNGVGLFGEPGADAGTHVEAKLSLVESTSPPVQQWKTRHHYELKVDVPGVKESDLDVWYSGQTVKIWAERSDSRTGRPMIIEKTHKFPEPVNFQKAKASLSDGVLSVIVPLQDQHRLTIGATSILALMTRDPIYCREYDKVEEVIKKMIDNRHSFLPVCEQQSLRVVAVVTERDIVRKCFVPGQGFDGGREIKAILSQRLVFVLEEHDVSVALNVMDTNMVRRVPVCDRQQGLLGVLSTTDCVAKQSSLDFEKLQDVFARRYAQPKVGPASNLGNFRIS